MHHHALDGDHNPVGVGFILMDDMPGQVLDLSKASPQQRKKVISQIADIYIELHRHPLENIGCLIQPKSRWIGAFARECLTDFEHGRMHPLGPFDSLYDYYKATIHLLLSLIHRQEILTDNAVEAFLMFRYLLGKVPAPVQSPHFLNRPLSMAKESRHDMHTGPSSPVSTAWYSRI